MISFYKVFMILPAVLLLQVSCAQNTKNLKNMITKEQYNNISKDVKKYDYNPTYQLKVNTNLCTYEIYINDMLVDYSFTTGRTAGEQNIDIPQYILKSGVQSIRFKVYPNAIENGILEKWVNKNADFTVRIVHREYYKIKFEDFKEVLQMKLPKIDGDLPFIELKGEFIAEVPYTLNGWNNGMNLSKEDPKNLEIEVLEKCNQFRTAFENKDVSTIATMIYKREKEIAQSHFLVSGSSNSYDNGWGELEEKCKAIVTMKPIENYSMRIFGNGKIVCLLKTTGKFKNLPVVYGTTGEKLRFYGLFFYRPTSDGPLEVIR
jgi:hypothetical protein